MTKLRIGWATPWNERSAIANCAAQLAFELHRRGHEVTILRTEVDDALDLPARPAPGPILNLTNIPTTELRERFDIVVGHIGDHYGFHGALLSRLDEADFVGIFHDAEIANLAWDSAASEKGYRDLLQATYGEDTWPVGHGFFDDPQAVVRHRPMLEWLACRTIAAVAHSGHYAERLRKACPGPVEVIPLALEFHSMPPTPKVWDNKLLIAVIGRANFNKRIDQLIFALAASPRLRSNCRIRIIGEAAAEDREALTNLARKAGIATPQFLGWVDDDDLPWALRDVDVISCLRNPVLEGGSASLLLAMSSGRPTIVSNHGAYTEVPEDSVLRCEPGFEARDMMRHLERLLKDPARGAAMCQRAGEYVSQHRVAPVYVDALEPLLEKVVARKAEFHARRRMAGVFASFGLLSQDPAAIRASLALEELLAVAEKT